MCLQVCSEEVKESSTGQGAVRKIYNASVGYRMENVVICCKEAFCPAPSNTGRTSLT